MGSLLSALAGTKAFSASSIGQTFEQPPFWSLDAPTWLPAPVGERERIANDFGGYVRDAYKRNGIVFACSLVRLQVFSQIQFRIEGVDGTLRRDQSLRLLERPWPAGTTGDLLARMEQDATLAGNAFIAERDSRLRRLRPDWVTIITGSPSDDPFDIDAKVLAFIYDPRWQGRRRNPVLLTPDQVAHWAPIPDPVAQWRGMSWLTPVLREIESDTAATRHKLKFFDRGATSNIAITYDKDISPEALPKYIELFREKYEGLENAYGTMHIGGGADAKAIGANLRQLDFKSTQGAGETRIAAASGVGAIIAQFSEGMQGSSLNAGNYGAARRRFSDITMQHLWQTVASALSTIVRPADGERLWFDRMGVPFLQEDERDAAEILKERFLTIESGIRSGYTPGSVVAAVNAGDPSLLEHTGLFSVQLQPPGSDAAAVRVSDPKSLKALIDEGWRIVDVNPEETQ